MPGRRKGKRAQMGIRKRIRAAPKYDFMRQGRTDDDVIPLAVGQKYVPKMEPW